MRNHQSSGLVLSLALHLQLPFNLLELVFSPLSFENSQDSKDYHCRHQNQPSHSNHLEGQRQRTTIDPYQARRVRIRKQGCYSSITHSYWSHWLRLLEKSEHKIDQSLPDHKRLTRKRICVL